MVLNCDSGQFEQLLFVLGALFIAVDEPLAARVNKHLFKDSAGKTLLC